MRCNDCIHAIKKRVKAKKIEVFILCRHYDMPIEKCDACNYYEEDLACSEKNKD